MPGSILNADTGFPKFAGTETTEEKLDTVVNYLYMLLEQLRYSMGNLGTENFNEKSLIDLQEMITEPVYIQLQDTEQQLSNQITVTAQGITTRMDQFGVTEFSTTSTYGRGAYVSYGGKFYYCTDPVTTPGPWTGSTNWQETSDASMESQHSQLTQTVNGFTLTVSNNSSNTQSTLTLTSGGFSLSTAVINLSGLVSFTSLSDPSSSTQIDGGHIMTGTLSCDTLNGGTINGQSIFGGTIYGTTINSALFASEAYEDYTGGYYYFSRMELNNSAIGWYEVKRTTNAMYGSYSTKSLIGQLMIDYANSRLLLSTKQTLYKALKMESGGNLSIDATYTTNASGSVTRSGLYNGKIYIGASGQDVSGTTYCNQVRIGGERGMVLIYASDIKLGDTGNSYPGSGSATGVWEFLKDGIYYNGVRKVSV